MKRRNPHAKLIDDLGGPAAVAKLIRDKTGDNIRPYIVRNYKFRGEIAHKYRALIAAEAEARRLRVPSGFLPGMADVG